MNGVRRLKRSALHVMRPVELAALALDRHQVTKLVVHEFERRVGDPPDPEAAALLVRAHEEGTAPPWLVAILLGAVGHASGYPTALAILAASSNGNEGAYVSEAIVRMVGGRCADDLLPCLGDDESAAVRNLAARTLALAGVREALPAICDAATRERIGIRRARSALVTLDVDDEVVAGWLRSEQKTEITLGCQVVLKRLERTRMKQAVRAPERWLAPLLRAALERPELTLLRYEHEVLEEWARG